jgi:hypothetical protein
VSSRCRGNNVSTKFFPSNGCCTVVCLHSCYLEMALHVIILKWILWKQGTKVWNGFIRVRIGTNDGTSWIFGLDKRRGIYWTAKGLLSFQYGPCSMELVHWIESLIVDIKPNQLRSPDIQGDSKLLSGFPCPRKGNPDDNLESVVTCINDYRRGLDRWTDLLTTYRSSLQITVTLSLFPH